MGTGFYDKWIGDSHRTIMRSRPKSSVQGCESLESLVGFSYPDETWPL